jgi:PRC-barrel domain
MRLSELLGAEVVDRRGDVVGKVLDVRLTRSGPLIESFGAAFELRSLIVGRHTFGARLGFEENDVRGPAPLRWLFRWVHRDARLVPWSEVRAVQAHRIHVGDTHGTDSANDEHRRAGGETLDAGLHLLDKQMIDVDELMSGNVDDLRFAFPADGGRPYVVSVLSGPGALASRIGGRPGRWIASVHRRLHPAAEPDPAELSFGVIRAIGSHVDLAVSREDLEVFEFERWVRDRIISKIPGH